MTRDPRMHPPISLDDDAIGLLIRDVAQGWTMPPVRLDAPTWRDRVRGRQARLIDSARLALGRAGRASTAALALTVVAALAAAIISRPPHQPAGSPNPTDGATNGAAAPSGSTSGPSAAPTPLPKLLLNGELPFPTRILVANEIGDISLVDLGTGTLGASIARAQWPSAMTVTSDGLVVCICITTSDVVDGFATRFDIRLKSFTRTTTPIRDDAVDVLVGTPDPREPATRGEHVWTAVSFSTDDRLAFVGWSVREGRVWHSGLVVVDIEAGAIVARQAFPDMTAGEGDARRTVGAPRVIGLAADGSLFLARWWAEWASANLETEPAREGEDAYQAQLVDGAVSGLEPFAEAASCGPTFDRAGARPAGGFWVTCTSNGGRLTLHRIAPDGTSLGSTSMTRSAFVDGDTTAVSPDGRMFFAWDPGTRTIARIDIDTGDRVDQVLDTATVAADPLQAIGRWLAPPAAAKSILRGGVRISPDGSRLYLLATQPVTDERLPAGSDGIFVVDAATLQVIDHWPPTADLMAMALSADGSLLYAAGLPGVDASGAAAPRQGASVTVYDTTNGNVRLIAGELGMGLLTFPGALIQ